jgi:PIN domain nuclease of toxin-antitoxin system
MATADAVPAAILLDTHALIWWAASASRLSRTVRRLIANEETTIYVSAASAWEIATKVRLGKLTWSAPQSVQTYCAEQRFERLDMTFAHAEKAGAWPQDHGDPFDRLLAAQSLIEGIPLASNDPQVRAFGVDMIW